MKKTKNKARGEKNIDKEIAAQLKKSLAKPQAELDSKKIEQSIDEELEEESESSLNDLEFHQFMRQSAPEGERAPVLERIAGSAPRPIFIGGIPQGPQGAQGSDEESRSEVKYFSSGPEKTEPKYFESTTENYVPQPLEPRHLNLNEVGRRRESPLDVNQQAFFIKPLEFKTGPPVEERSWGPERVDFERAGRENPFERERTKYEKYKPKVPK